MRRLEGYNVELTQTLEFGQQKSRRAADEKVRFNLAVSLHSAIDEVRTQIMPFNETFPQF